MFCSLRSETFAVHNNTNKDSIHLRCVVNSSLLQPTNSAIKNPFCIIGLGEAERETEGRPASAPVAENLTQRLSLQGERSSY